VFQQIEQQLKHQTEISGWDTSGWVDGSRLRGDVIKIQGLEPEFKKDLESRIRSLEHDVAHYKKYYDWHFKLRHVDKDQDGELLWKLISKKVGWKID
jgi:hypothetical protein